MTDKGDHPITHIYILDIHTVTRTMKRRNVLRQAGIGLGAVSIAGFAGCMGADDESSDDADAGAGGEDLTELDYMIPEGQLDIPMLVAAGEDGTFRDAGIDFRPEITGYGRYARSLTSGDEVVGNVNQDIAITAWESGDEVTLFGPNLAQFNLMFAQPGSGIESPADFTEDTTIGVPPWASGTSLLVRTMILDEYGIDIREDTDSTEVDVPALYELFTEQEEFDVMLQFTGFTVAGLADDIGDVVFDPLEYWQERTGNPPFVTYFAARTDWLEDNHETAAQFLEGWENTRSHFDENIDDIMTRFGLLAGLETDEQVEVVRDVFEDGVMTTSPENWDDEFIDSQWELFELMEELDIIDMAPPRAEAAISYDELQ